jgi:alkylhydroperoxidase family enzyme
LQEEDDSVAQALARTDLAAAKLPENEHVLLEFVGLLTKHAYRNTAEDVQRLRDVGWSDEQIAECVYITALFAFFNRVADAFGLEDPGYQRLAQSGRAVVKPAERGCPDEHPDV